MGRHDRRRSGFQKKLRRRRNERAFLFDMDLERCLGDVEGEEWALAIAACAGDVGRAALDCNLDGIPRSAKVLWGRSAEEAVGTYRRWQTKRRK